MSYIGASPIVGNFQVCDAISVVNGQAAYTMQVGSANVFPESANHMLVSLNGILQKPNGSFTISGSTITFSSNLVTGDVIDFIQLLGDVLDIGTPSDATVTNAKTSFVSTSSAAGLQIKGDGTTDGTLQLNCSQNSHGIKLKSPPHSASASYTLTFPNNDGDANQFLQTNGSGVLSFAAAGGTTVKLAETNITSSTANISFDGLFSSTYPNYRMVLTDVIGSASAAVRVRINVGGSEITASNYFGAVTSVYGQSSGATSDASRDWSQSSWRFANWAVSTNARYTSHYSIDIPNPLLSTSAPAMFGQHAVLYNNAQYVVTGSTYMYYDSASAMSGMKIYMDSGTIAQANFYLYGIKD